MKRRMHPVRCPASGYTLAQRVDAAAGGGPAMKSVRSSLGVPGQRPETLADDILLARELHVDMCGAGPFIPQADTLGATNPRDRLSWLCGSCGRIAHRSPWSNLPRDNGFVALILSQGNGRACCLPSGGMCSCLVTPAAHPEDYCIGDNKTSSQYG